VNTWEVDFYSRPLVDEEGKKVWELLICAQNTNFRYEARCSQKDATAAWLRERFQEALSKTPDEPARVRYFRSATGGMIERLCEEQDLVVRPSRRTFRLRQWLQEREQRLYPTMNGFTPGNLTPLTNNERQPNPLPDALRGDRWSFVSLTVADIKELADLAIPFGEQIPIPLASKTVVPGVVVYSQRAKPLAAWMQSAEPVALDYVEEARNRGLVLEAGGEDRWQMVGFPEGPLLAEGKKFQENKTAANGYHFLVVQDPKTENFTGFWTLLNMD